jgi:predicted DNA-binding transcriptional regulator AlpA
MVDRILRYSDLKEMGVVNSRPTLHRWIKDLGFPQGFLLGPNSRGWPEREVEDWLESRLVTIGRSYPGLKKGYRDG